MKNLELIAMIGKNNELGCRGKLLWNLNDDLTQFQNLTLDKTLIMGMKTYMSKPRNIYSKGKNIVLTRKNLINPLAEIYNSKEEVLHKVYRHPDKEYMIIGGEQIFNLFINDVEIMYIMEVNQEYIDADTFFPKFNNEDFDKELLLEGKQDAIEYKEYKYIRRR